jgi:hypothetical protein
MGDRTIDINDFALNRLRSLYAMQRDYGHRYIDNNDYYYELLWKQAKIEYDAIFELIMNMYEIDETELLKIVQAR